MGRTKLQHLAVYLDGETAAAVRLAARSRNVGISAYFKELIARDLHAASDDREESRASLGYLKISVNAILDELWKLPIVQRLPDEKPLRQKVRESHAQRFGSVSDAN